MKLVAQHPALLFLPPSSILLKPRTLGCSWQSHSKEKTELDLGLAWSPIFVWRAQNTFLPDSELWTHSNRSHQSSSCIPPADANQCPQPARSHWGSCGWRTKWNPGRCLEAPSFRSTRSNRRRPSGCPHEPISRLFLIFSQYLQSETGQSPGLGSCQLGVWHRCIWLAAATDSFRHPRTSVPELLIR